MDHISGNDLIEAAICKGKCGDICLCIRDVSAGTAVLLCLFQHLPRVIRRGQLPAFWRYNGREKPCPAGAFQYCIIRINQSRYKLLQLLVGLFVNDIDEYVIYTGYFIPEHPDAS